MSSELETTYCGLSVRSPVIVGASPDNLSSEHARQYTLAGAGAIMLPSLFEEQVLASHREIEFFPGEEEQALNTERFLKEQNAYSCGVQEYLRCIARIKRQVGIPVFANLHASTDGNWLCIGERLQSAGADGIELSFANPCCDPQLSADETEETLLKIVRHLSEVVTVPIAVKLTPFHSNLANLAQQLKKSGASGVTCFGFEPSWQVRQDLISPSSHWSFGTNGNMNLTLSGILRVSSANVGVSIAASGGVTTAEDSIKALLAGADVVMLTSEIHRAGPDVIAHVCDGLSIYLEKNQHPSLQEFLQHRPERRLDRQALLECLAAVRSY